MTEKTDIEALRRRSNNLRTADQTDAFIDLLLDKLEADRQRADELQESRDQWKGIAHDFNVSATSAEMKLNAAEAELAELRGEQEPVGLIKRKTPLLSDGAFRYSFISDANLPLDTEIFSRQPKPVAVHPDTVRMDWLCAHVVEVRQPMFYGSHAMFFGQCDSADDEEYHSKLREQIDAKIEAAGIVVKGGE